MELYHATFQAYIPNIELYGLMPSAHSNWDCTSGFVYLSNNFDVAMSFCEAAENTPDEIYESGICCFKINSDNLDSKLLFDDPNISDSFPDDSQCFSYAGSIPSQFLDMFYCEKNKVPLSAQIRFAEEKSGSDGRPSFSIERGIESDSLTQPSLER